MRVSSQLHVHIRALVWLSHTTASYGSRLLFPITSSTTLASPSSVPPKLAASAAFLLSFASAYVCSECKGGWGEEEEEMQGGREGEEGMCSVMEDGKVRG